jgi:tape measure domain-containing protein
MAVTVEELRATLRMEMKPYMQDLQRLHGVNAKAARQVENTWRQANRRLDGIGKNMAKSLVAPMAGIGAVLGARELANLADTWSDLNSRVRLAAGGVEQGNEVMERLGEVARRTYSSLEQTAEGYLANATTLKELGYSTNQTLDFTESLNNALVVSGAKGQRAASVMDALSKAMALGKLSGDNLNTVIASGGRVAEALAAGLGVGVNQLRALGAQGKITGRDVVQALSSQMEKLRKEAEAMPATISDGIQLLRNALLEYVGNGDQATGVSAKISEALVIMADNFDKTADVALQLAAVIAGALIGRSLLKMISTLGLAGSALVKFTQALAAARTMGGLAASMSGLGAVAGPVGMLIGGALVSSLLLYSKTVGASSEGAQLFAEHLKRVEEAAKDSGDAVEEAGRKNKNYKEYSLTKKAEASVEALAAIRQEAVNMLEAFSQVQAMSLTTPEQYAELKRLRDGIEDGSIAADVAKDSLSKMATADYNFRDVADSINPILEKLASVSIAAKQTAADLAAVSGMTIEDRATRSSLDPYIQERKAANEYVKEQVRLAGLAKAEHAIEAEKLKVRNAALREGVTLTEQQIEAIAKANVAGDKSRSGEGKKTSAPKKTADDRFDNLTQQIQDRIAAMRIEAEVTGLVYQEQEKRRMALELEQEALKIVREEARKKGDQDWQNAKLSPEQIAKINEMSEAYAQQAEALRLIEEAQGRAESAANEFYDTFKSGMIGALKGAESFSDALSKILEKLADMVLNSAFDSLFNGASSSGGWLTNIFKGLGFSSGGYTGPGPKNKPAGIVHAGEVVWSQDDIRNAGGVAAVEAMRKGMAGMVMPASIQAPAMPRLVAPAAGQQQIVVNFQPQIDASGADPAAIARLETGLAKVKNEIPSQVIASVRKAQKSNVKLG